ncbi:hypothetical protein CTheo_5093 [Ceratobasidium theobromae]|uniref:Uncharacterized protein n=1 Tax=Ceratobasidium theobromae TaxID=1582974 RepID=A0A5N5QIY6_9AGAM|nr:hypothetical protein CTheo_5093 [Ceratobasidium theobromae]
MASTATANPTYEDAQRDVDKLKDSMTPDKQRAVSKAIADFLADPETSKRLLQQVQYLSDSTKKLHDAFNRISIGLGEVDQNNYKDEHGKPLPKFEPQWDGYCVRFIKLLWESRDAATNTASYAREFKETFLPAIEEAIAVGEKDPNQWNAVVAEIQVGLRRFAERPNPALEKSPRPVPPSADLYMVHSQAFLNLIDDIVAFRNTFASFPKDKDIGFPLESEFDRLLREIEELTTEIERTKKAIEDWRISALQDMNVMTAELIAALNPLGSEVEVGITRIRDEIKEAQTLAFLLKTQADLQAELDKKNAELKMLMTGFKQPLKLRSEIESQIIGAKFTGGRLDQFANIWNSVQFNTRELNNVLSSDITEDYFIVLKNQISILKDGHNLLCQALESYATLVSDLGIPQS